MSIATLDYSAVMERSQAGLETERGQIRPLGYAYFKASASALGIAVACVSEAYTMTVAMHSRFPVLSDGTDLASEMLDLRYGVIAVLILAHIVLHDNLDQASQPFRRLIHKFRILPVLAILGGMAVFMFTATAQVAGGDDGQWGLSGLSLGIACGALFTVSFLACNMLVGKFLPVLRSILSGIAQRMKTARITRDIAEADEYHARIKTLQRDIASRDKPDALQRRAAEEAAMVVGWVAAEAHDLHASREAISNDIRPEDIIEGLSDTPLTALDRRQSYLKSLNVAFFLDLLKRKEA